MRYSIILPIYNVEKYLSACIESIVAQTSKGYEIILVDDGSKDSSGKICDEYAAKYDYITVIHKSNGGQSTARNEGLKKAIGEYVYFVDSDDYLIDEKVLSKISSRLDNAPDVVAFSSVKWFESTSIQSEYFVPLKVSEGCHNATDILCELIDRDSYSNAPWCKVIKRSILIDNNIVFENGIVAEDNDWYYKVVSHINTIEIINEPLYVYRQREGSTSHTHSNKKFEDYLMIIEKWSKFVSQGELTGDKKVIRNSLAKQYCHALIGYAALQQSVGYEKRLKSVNYLLQYSNNQRVKQFRLLNKMVGMKGLIALLRIVRKIKK